ncbi:MAG TPA: hypothetical protein VGP76_30050 [Planctomycetaceae bacterium]|jgi:hypothetical protein|nr:hypothetical protein [Planctomycetaceae bacterium]
MAVTVNVGFSRKVGEPNYGSRGASVQLELELDRSAIEGGERFQSEIDRIFELARDAVDRELQRNLVPSSELQPDLDECSEATKSQNGRTRAPRPATPNQVRAIQAIAQNRGVDLSQLLAGEFDAKTAEELTIVEASRLIDRLQSFPMPSVADSADDP